MLYPSKRSPLLVLLFLCVTLLACKLGDKLTGRITAENIEESEGAVPMKHDKAKVTWVVDKKGDIHALVKDDSGKVVEDVEGKILVKPLIAKGEAEVDAKAEAKVVPVKVENKLVTASAGELEAPLTEVKYNLKVDGKPLRGVVHVPLGGTAKLNASAKVAAKAKIEAGAKGPHGGTVQVVGDDIVEIVGDKQGEMRVYLLDDDLKPIEIKAEKKVRLVLSGNRTEVVVLQPEGKAYLVGKVKGRVNPKHVTVVVEHDNDVEVALCGYRPGATVVVHHRAPRVHVFVVNDWKVHAHGRGRVHVKVKGKGKGHYKHKHKGRGKHGGGTKVHVKVH